jgi:hypothetical protein
MTISFVFWFLMLCLVIFGGWRRRSDPAYPWTDGLIPFLCLFLLGWKVFGWPVAG